MIKLLGVDPKKTLYLADLGINKDYRNKGFGTELLSCQFRILQESVTVLIRTSKANLAAQEFYRIKFGFQDLNLTQNVYQPRLDGTIQSDKRVIMTKVIL
nr:GNAT family N-acetyltransferase [Anabaena sp. UHCC 0253]